MDDPEVVGGADLVGPEVFVDGPSGAWQGFAGVVVDDDYSALLHVW